MPTWPITLIGVKETVEYSESDAKATLAGYAFGKTALTWKPPAGVSLSAELAERPRAAERYQWGYRTFDCANTSQALSITDILATAALDSRVGGVATLGLLAIADELEEVLSQIPQVTTFWDLPLSDLGTESPTNRTASWWMWRAWTLLMGLDQVNRAVTHKLLHRRRPSLFPMLDSVTSPHLGEMDAWSTIHEDLRRHKNQYMELEIWFADLVSGQGVPLTRLRIHDILLWADCNGDRPEMQAKGREFLRGQEPADS